MSCDVVVLCGGLGTRLRSVTDTPKVIAEVQGEPFLKKIIDHISNQGFNRFIFCTGYKADDVENYLASIQGNRDFLFSREKEPLGTGGAIKQGKNCIQSDHFFVVNGDSYCPCDFKALLQFQEKQNGIGSIVASLMGDVSDYGTLKVDSDQRIQQFLEKDASLKNELVNAGIYCFHQNIFNFFSKEESFSLEKEVFPYLISENVYAFRIQSEFLDIGTPDRFSKANKDQD